MKLLLKLLRGRLLKRFDERMKSKGFKTMVVVRLNDRIDLPKLNESQEEALLSGLYDIISGLIKEL